MFFERLQSLCTEKNTDVTNLLKNLNLSTSKGTSWKNGSLPKGDTLIKIAEYFGVSTDYLLTGKEAQQKSLSPISEDKQRLLNMYDLLTEREQGEILGELNVLTKERQKKQEQVG